jgi:hypothetical protein
MWVNFPQAYVWVKLKILTRNKRKLIKLNHIKDFEHDFHKNTLHIMSNYHQIYGK